MLFNVFQGFSILSNSFQCFSMLFYVIQCVPILSNGCSIVFNGSECLLLSIDLERRACFPLFFNVLFRRWEWDIVSLCCSQCLFDGGAWLRFVFRCVDDSGLGHGFRLFSKEFTLCIFTRPSHIDQCVSSVFFATYSLSPSI